MLIDTRDRDSALRAVEQIQAARWPELFSSMGLCPVRVERLGESYAWVAYSGDAPNSAHLVMNGSMIEARAYDVEGRMIVNALRELVYQ